MDNLDEEGRGNVGPRATEEDLSGPLVVFKESLLLFPTELFCKECVFEGGRGGAVRTLAL